MASSKSPVDDDDDGPAIVINRTLYRALMTFLNSAAIEPRAWDNARRLRERLRQCDPIGLAAIQEWLRHGPLRR